MTNFDNTGLGSETRPSQPLSAAQLEKYRSELVDLKLTEAQETELLEILWSINVMFVEMGFKPNACGLLFSEFNQHSGADEPDATLLPSATTELLSEDRGKERS